MRKPFYQYILIIGLASLLTACSSGPEIPEFQTTGKTIAPKNATSRPYQIKGIWYYPQPHFEYEEVGIASFYGGGDVFHGRKTAIGEVFDMNEVSAAHKTLPLPCIVHVTNLENGREIQAKVNDRGPFIEGRIIDVSRRTAQLLGFEQKGTAKVRVRTLVPETLALRGMDPSTVLVERKAIEGNICPLPSQTCSLVSRLPDNIFDEIVDEEVGLIEEDASLMVKRPPAPLGKGIYVLVKSCQTPHEAKNILYALIDRINAPLETVQQNGPDPYVVRAGPFLSMAEANQTLDQLANAGHGMSRITIQR